MLAKKMMAKKQVPFQEKNKSHNPAPVCIYFFELHVVSK